jgi:hypothetical protein
LAATALRAAAAAADGHEPLLARICTLAQRARISMNAEPAHSCDAKRPLEQPGP